MCIAMYVDGSRTPANVSETENLLAGDAGSRMDEPERQRNQSDAPNMHTEAQSIVNDQVQKGSRENLRRNQRDRRKNKERRRLERARVAWLTAKNQ